MNFDRIKRILIGDPLSNEMASHEQIPKWKALAVLSSDALSSVAYATEEILIPLSIFASTAIVWSMPIALSVATLLLIVTISYQETIDAYPAGGGAYTVAKENLGTKAGLVAGSSLLIDYILTVAVSVSAGVENIVSAFPALAPHKVTFGVVIILIIMIFNLRGVRESASIFAIPTYIFILSFVILIGVGFWNILFGEVAKVVPVIHNDYPAIPIFLLLRAFSSGCAALTGIEAISNGVPIFKHPSAKNAKITLRWMAVILVFLFLCITLLTHMYGITHTSGQTTISLLAGSIFGKGYFYYSVQFSTALILILAANTGYADFPRLSSLLAKDRFLPKQLSSLGDRLVFSNGIVGLSVAAIILLIMFKGSTHHLIPLYAVGVFLSFTLSQTGMIVHHFKLKKQGWIKSLGLNLLGAMTTFVVLMVIAITKFTHGAWAVIVLIPSLVLLFTKIKEHYLWITKQLSAGGYYPSERIDPITYTAIVPISGIHPGVVNALKYASSISDDVRACYVDLDAKMTERIKQDWQRWAPHIALVVLKSPYRSVISPILQYIDEVHKQTRNEMISIVIPEFVPPKWYHQFLHNQTTFVLKAFLSLKRGKVVTSVRYHLHESSFPNW